MQSRAFLIATLAAAAAFFFITPAQAQMVCGKRADMVRQVEENYGETRIGHGMAGVQAIVELYTNEETLSWSFLQTDPSGMTCIVAVGELWQIDPGELTPTGDPV